MPSRTRSDAPTTGVDDPAWLTTPSSVNVGAATVMCIVPVRFWYVARMSASPDSATVTRPDEDTVAIAELDDCQVAWPVTFWFVPLEKFAVAVNCDDAPIAGVVPLIATDVSVALEGAVGVLPHAHTSNAMTPAAVAAPSR